MFAGVTGKPVLPTEGVLDHGLNAVLGKPVGPFPAVLDPKPCAGALQSIVERCFAQISAGFELPIGPSHLVMETEDFGDALAQEGTVVRPGCETTDIHRPQIERRLAGQD